MSQGMASDSATTVGWLVFVAAIGMMFGMLAVDIASLNEWSQMTTPVFVGTTIGHVSAVIGAFLGGKLIPESRDPRDRTRLSDDQLNAILIPGQVEKARKQANPPH